VKERKKREGGEERKIKGERVRKREMRDLDI
jgi:hypothetical protein